MALGYTGEICSEMEPYTSHTYTLKQPQTFGKTSGATMFAHLYHKQLLNTLLPLISHCRRQPPLLSAKPRLWLRSGDTRRCYSALDWDCKERRVAIHTWELGLCKPMKMLPVA